MSICLASHIVVEWNPFITPNPLMKIAFAHCRLLPWWAQKVLEDEIQKRQDKNCHIFTLLSKTNTLHIQDKKIGVTTVLPRPINNFFLWCTEKKIPILSVIFDYRNLIIFAPLWAYIMSKQIKKYHPQEIFISSFARSKNIDTCGVPTTLYLHSPMQYIRTHHDEYTKKIKGLKGWLFKIIAPWLQKRDQHKRSYTKVIANSHYTAIQAKKIYGLTSQVHYPTIAKEIMGHTTTNNTNNYFVYVWRLVSFVKELDIIIGACNRTNTPLIIIWDGPDKITLQKQAGDTIVFVPWIENIHERIRIIESSIWLINITKESFGITTMEALLLGVPVIGYNDGASPELVDAESGVLIDKKNEVSLIHAITAFQKQSFDREKIQSNARKLYEKNR